MGIMEVYLFSIKRTENIQNWISMRKADQQFQTPERSVGCGGSVVGRKNLKAIKCVADHFSATILNQPINIHILLGKIEREKDLSSTLNSSDLSCSVSPTSFPTLISLFKTPNFATSEECHDIAEESLGKRLGLDKILGNKNSSHAKTKGVPKFNANLAWAEETSPIMISPIVPQRAENDNEISGRIFLHNEESTNKDNISTPIGRTKISKPDIAEVINEAKEEAEQALKEARQAIKPPKNCSKRSILKDINKINKYPIALSKTTENSERDGRSKRIKLDGEENLPPQAATKKPVSKKSQTTKKKKLALPKGQMKMTAFLRM